MSGSRVLCFADRVQSLVVKEIRFFFALLFNCTPRAMLDLTVQVA